MSERAQTSLQPMRELSVAEIDDVSGATKTIFLPNLGLTIYAGKDGYGAWSDTGSFIYGIQVKT